MTVDAGVMEVAETMPVVARIVATTAAASLAFGLLSAFKRRFLAKERYETAKRS